MPTLTRMEQAALVSQLIQSIQKTIIGNIESGAIPEEWDGLELREYVTDKMRELAMSGRMDKRRLREYRNAVLVRNL